MSTPPKRVDLRPDHWAIVRSALRQHVPDREVLVFGSRATGNAKEYSDLDLAIMGEEPLSLRVVSALDEALGESDLPFKVDIVEWARIDEGFREIIRGHGVVVQGPSDDQLTHVPLQPRIGTSRRCGSTRPEGRRRVAENAVLIAGTGEHRERVERLKSIEDVCLRVTSGGTPSRRKASYYEGGHWPWLKTQELRDGWLDDSEEHITDTAVASSSAKILPKNSVLMAMYGATVGRLGILRRPMTCNQACCAMIVDPAQADYRYLFYQLLHSRPRIRNLSTGAAQQNLSGRLIRSLCFSFPSLSEQRAIAHILGTLDDKIELNRRMNRTLEAMARALFKSWFVDFDPVRAKMEGRDTGLPQHIADLFPDRLVDSEMGEIPEGWEVSEIGKEVSAVGGSTPSTKEPSYWHQGQHHWATPKDLSKLWSPVLLQTSRKITNAGLARIGSGLLPVGTVLMSSRAPIGYLAIAEVPTAVNQGFVAMRCDQRLPNLYVLFWCYQNLGYIRNIAGGSTFAEISKKAFRSVPVLVPPEALLGLYERLSRPPYDQVVARMKEAATLATLRDTLLPKLISGEIRLGKATKAMEAGA